jgi:N-methylhydantoinase A
VAKGRDPRDFTLFAYGGNGGVYAAEIARSLEMRRVLIPPTPGLFSAYGLLLAEVEHVYVQSHVRKLAGLTGSELGERFDAMEREGLRVLEREGYDGDRVSAVRSVDLRYVGQSFALRIDVAADVLAAERPGAELGAAFDDEYAATYGHRVDREQIELVNLVLRVQGRGGHGRPERGAAEALPGGSLRDAYFGAAVGSLRTPVLGGREQLTGTRRGPLIVEEYDATTVVPPGATIRLDGAGNLEIRLEEE